MRYLLLIVLLTACGNPPINLKGDNCKWYGVDEQQNAPMGCPVDADGWPIVEILSTEELKSRCGNTRGLFEKRFAWGCVEYADGRYRPVSSTNQQTIYHEQCHCILGQQHFDETWRTRR